MKTLCTHCRREEGHSYGCPVEYEEAPLSGGQRWYKLKTNIRLTPGQAYRLEGLLRKHLKLDAGVCGLDEFECKPEMVRKDRKF